jgi:hypothetical protein
MLAQLAVLDIASFNKVVELASQAGKWGIGGLQVRRLQVRRG